MRLPVPFRTAMGISMFRAGRVQWLGANAWRARGMAPTERWCSTCLWVMGRRCVDDELHAVFECCLVETERAALFATSGAVEWVGAYMARQKTATQRERVLALWRHLVSPRLLGHASALWCMLQRLEVRRAFLAEHRKQREGKREGGHATGQRAIGAVKRTWGVSRRWPGLSSWEVQSLMQLTCVRLTGGVAATAVARSVESKRVLEAMVMPEFASPHSPVRGGGAVG